MAASRNDSPALLADEPAMISMSNLPRFLALHMGCCLGHLHGVYVTEDRHPVVAWRGVSESSQSGR